jgi:hypothetical protein
MLGRNCRFATKNHTVEFLHNLGGADSALIQSLSQEHANMEAVAIQVVQAAILDPDFGDKILSAPALGNGDSSAMSSLRSEAGDLQQHVIFHSKDR